MTKFPKISIITPVYNRVEMLEQTILSVLKQKYSNMEYIIVDGGSTDGTVDLIRKYADRVANGTYGSVDFKWLSEKDNGMYHAIMKGMKLATGDVVAWINSDDMYHTGALHIVGELFAQLPDVAWLTGTPTLYNSQGLCVKTFPTQYWTWKRFQRGDFRWLQQESTFFRRDLFNRVGGLSLEYKLAADFELWCKMFQVTQLYSVNTVLGGFRQHGNQLSVAGVAKYEAEVKTICERYAIRYKPLIRNRWIKKITTLFDKRKAVNYSFENAQWQIS